MSWGQIFFLGILQGLTEFLPVSSSGHLVLAQNLMGLNALPLTLDAFLHLGTLLAVLIFLRQELKDIFWGTFQKEGTYARRIAFFIAIASIPAALAGFLFEKQISQLFSSTPGVGLGLLITSGLLIGSFWVKKQSLQIKDLPFARAFLIGIFQAVSIVPGISRSGATIAAGLWLGLTPSQAFTFSFLLSIPAVIGANLLQIKDLSVLPNPWFIIWGVAIAFVSGFLALKFLQKILLSEKLHYFAAYTLLLSVVALALHFLVF